MPKNPFFADKVVLKNGGVIETEDGTDIVAVNADGSAVTITGTETIIASEVALAEGAVLVGNSSGVAVALDASAGGNVLVGNDTTMVALDGSGDTKVLVGNGTTMTSVALSQDATMTNAGAVTVASSNAGFSVGTTFTTGSTTTSSGAGAVAITGAIHEITTSGADALTLADGAEGQHLYVVYAAEGAGGDAGTLTPTNLAGANTTVTFTDLGDSAHLLFTAGAWYFLGGEATVA